MNQENQIENILSFHRRDLVSNMGLATSRLRKHTYSNILKILLPQNENFQIKKSDILHISAQNIDCWYPLEPPRWGGSNAYLQSIFLAEIRKILYTQFYYINVGFKGVKII